jgi:hypothetical protein
MPQLLLARICADLHHQSLLSDLQLLELLDAFAVLPKPRRFREPLNE